MSPLLNIAIVALGGAIGSCLRYGVGQIDIIASHKGLSTIIVNVLGCFIIGLCYSLLSGIESARMWRLLLMIGLLGGFTTFSTYALDTITMIKSGELIKAIIYIATTNIAALIAVVAGIYLPSLILKYWAQ